MDDQSPNGAENSPRNNGSSLPFASGLAWVRAGVELLRAQALRLLVLGMVLQFIAGVSQIGVLGLFFILAVPAFSAGMLQAMDITRHGRRPSLLTVFAAFRGGPALPRLLLLGALGLGCTVVAVGLAVSGSVAELDPLLLQRLEAGDAAVLGELDPRFLQRVLLGMALGLLAGACLSYWAVPLIWFSELSLGQAIGRGLVALARQWRALLMLGAVLGLLSVPLVLLATFTLSAEVGGASAPILSLFLLLAGVAYQLLLFATQYASFRQVFGTDHATPTGPAEPPEDQLVA